MTRNVIASTDELSRLLRRLADRERVRSEATVQVETQLAVAAL